MKEILNLNAIMGLYMEIRKATLEDSKDIADIHIRSWRYAYKGIMSDDLLKALDSNTRIKAWDSILSDNSWPTYVAVDHSGSIEGFVHFCDCRDDDLDNEAYGEVTAIYVNPVVVGKGVGAKLFMKAIEHLRGEGRSKVVLWVLEKNRLGIDFYKKFGFKPDGAKKTHPNSGLVELRFSY